MKTSDLHFELPQELLATQPAEPRDAAKLLCFDRQTRTTRHQQVRDLPNLGILNPGDLLLVNRSKVIPACFKATRSATGGGMQGLYLSSTQTEQGPVWTTLLESRGKLQPGEAIALTDDARLVLQQNVGPGQWEALYEGPCDSLSLLQQIGTTPLPPYIRKARKKLGLDEVTEYDATRYNTVFEAGKDATDTTAASPFAAMGSVAAPTAGLHFTPELLATLKAQGIAQHSVVLHVGMGTFAPVKADTLEDHVMHEEAFVVDQTVAQAIADTKQRGNKILCVGTTTVRAVESLPQDILDDPRTISANTDLFITPPSPAIPATADAPAKPAHPGFAFRFTDALLTNFHLPQSTLLALVAALPNLGLDELKAIYQTAIQNQYRFYSYGDTMLIH